MNTIKMGSNIGTLKITQVGLKLGTLIVIKEGKKKMNIIRYLKELNQVKKWI